MSRAFFSCALLFLGCGSPADPDAGPMDAARADAGTLVPCAADTECDDGSFCNVLRCLPGNASADARGCVVAGSPCRVGEACDEAADQCVPEVCGPDPDRDGDGHDSVACGGNDCDDDDDLRYGGNTEVCDVMHDEDCDDTSLAGADDGDGDDDGFTSAMCCNGVLCGDDCDDTDRTVFPGAREVCNGRDDDCDGMTDEAGDVPLCPGGVCVAGRCDLAGWDRTFGGMDSDGATSVAMDDVGNVYVAVSVAGGVDFGAGADTGLGDRDAVLLALAPDGLYRWHRRYGTSGLDSAWHVAVDRSTGDVYFTGGVSGATDFGGGVRSGPSGFLVALDSDGAYRWDQPVPAGAIITAEARGGHVAVGGWLSGPFDFGGGERALGGADVSGFVARYTREGAHSWDRIVGGGAGTETYAAVGISAENNVVLVGAYLGGPIDLGGGVRPLTGRTDMFVASFENADGAPLWDYTVGGTENVNVSAATRLSSGDVIIGGNFSGTVDLGGGPLTAGAVGSSFLLQLSSTGVYSRHRIWGGDGSNNVSGLASSASDDVIAVGHFSGIVDFGGGARTAIADRDLFVVTFTSSFVHRRDIRFGAIGRNEATGVSVGPADSTAVVGAFFEMIDLGTGLRSATGETDGFVVRLAN